MKTLLAVVPLALSGQLPAQGSENVAPAESPRMTIIRFEEVAVRPQSIPVEFEDDALDLLEPPPGRTGCLLGRSPLVRVRENFDDQVMRSADEM